jgi:hypothetical protein
MNIFRGKKLLSLEISLKINHLGNILEKSSQSIHILASRVTSSLIVKLLMVYYSQVQNR